MQAIKIDECKESLNKSLCDNSKPWTKVFDLVEEKTNVPRLYIFLGKFFFYSFLSRFS